MKNKLLVKLKCLIGLHKYYYFMTNGGHNSKVNFHSYECLKCKHCNKII